VRHKVARVGFAAQRVGDHRQDLTRRNFQAQPDIQRSVFQSVRCPRGGLGVRHARLCFRDGSPADATQHQFVP